MKIPNPTKLAHHQTKSPSLCSHQMGLRCECEETPLTSSFTKLSRLFVCEKALHPPVGVGKMGLILGTSTTFDARRSAVSRKESEFSTQILTGATKVGAHSISCPYSLLSTSQNEIPGITHRIWVHRAVDTAQVCHTRPCQAC